MLSRVKDIRLRLQERKTQRRPVTGPPVAERQQEVEGGKEGAMAPRFNVSTSFLPHLLITLAG